MQALIEKIKEFNQYMKDEGQKGLMEGLKQFMDTFPTVEAIRWTQYAPYFNDGEPCEFGVHDPMFKVAGLPEDGGDYEDGFYFGWNSELKVLGKEFKDKAHELGAALQLLESVLQMICEDGQLSYTRGSDKLEIDSVNHD